MRFPMLHEKLKNQIQKACELKNNHEMYQEYLKANDGEYKNVLLCTFLPLILQTNYRVKGNWRPSVKETQSSFIMAVQVNFTPSHIF